MPEDGKPVVLLVDDEPPLRELAAIYLGRQLGPAFDMVEAEHGGEAVRLFEEYRREGCQVAGIVMDVRMPVMDGIEATGRILAIDPSPQVFIVTAFAEDHLINEALGAGAVEVYNKSMGIGVIAERVAARLRKRQAAVAPRAAPARA